jgi:hypothetical protein
MHLPTRAHRFHTQSICGTPSCRLQLLSMDPSSPPPQVGSHTAAEGGGSRTEAHPWPIHSPSCVGGTS